MTREEIKDELYRFLSDCVNNSYPIRNNTQKGRYRNAVNMAIASLEAWEKVRQEIEDMLETLSDGGDDWFTAEKLNDVLEIIDKHLQEVTTDERL